MSAKLRVITEVNDEMCYTCFEIVSSKIVKKDSFKTHLKYFTCGQWHYRLLSGENREFSLLDEDDGQAKDIIRHFEDARDSGEWINMRKVTETGRFTFVEYISPDLYKIADVVKKNV